MLLPHDTTHPHMVARLVAEDITSGGCELTAVAYCTANREAPTAFQGGGSTSVTGSEQP